MLRMGMRKSPTSAQTSTILLLVAIVTSATTPARPSNPSTMIRNTWNSHAISSIVLLLAIMTRRDSSRLITPPCPMVQDHSWRTTSITRNMAISQKKWPPSRSLHWLEVLRQFAFWLSGLLPCTDLCQRRVLGDPEEVWTTWWTVPEERLLAMIPLIFPGRTLASSWDAHKAVEATTCRKDICVQLPTLRLFWADDRWYHVFLSVRAGKTCIFKKCIELWKPLDKTRGI